MERRSKGEIFGGTILVLIGLVTLIGQFLPDSWDGVFGTFFLLGLGLIFMSVGIVTREDGWFIPGGILTGLGAGVALLAGPFIDRLGGDEGGWFLLVFALGWALIPLMTAIFTDETHWWALIPGGIIGLVGLAVLYGGLFINILEWVGKLWPVALIIAGVLVLWKVSRSPAEQPEKSAEKTA